MKQVIDVLIPILFFAPACATYFGGPIIGIGVTGVYLFIHYAKGSFLKYRNDPMQIDRVQDDVMEVDWDPSPPTSNTSSPQSFIK